MGQQIFEKILMRKTKLLLKSNEETKAPKNLKKHELSKI